ncbi:MAG TPA: DUF3131 domain-containing protein [Gemmatimonadaceae bacterium]|nr:DUF3131 domain-containing protein [Gemmatimonadaceae bacterium]
MSLILIGAAMIASATACTDAQGTAGDSAGFPAATASTAAPAATRPELTPEERKFYLDMAKSAWSYLDANYKPATGFVNATADWQNTTIWDIGGQLLAFRAAKELGILTPAEFEKRTRKALSTLEKVPLYRGMAYNKVYSTTTGKMGEGGSHGFAATDLGRFLVAAKVLAVQEPQLKEQIERVVKRVDFSQIVKNGYLHGTLTGSKGQPWTFQEGRIGYEQYVARGFAEWGADVGNALDVKKNGRPKKILGVEILEDTRWQDRLLSEPFILYGIELGLTGDYRDLAANVLKLQQARYDSTGKMTIVSEDASSIAPHYFYYYCVYCSGKPFVIDVSTPGKVLDGPRWVSTKAAFGWHALMPSDYTRKATEFVAAAYDPKKGWASGVMEDTGKSTNSWDVNTAAVLLEIAHYQLRGGKPLIETAPVTK